MALGRIVPASSSNLSCGRYRSALQMPWGYVEHCPCAILSGKNYDRRSCGAPGRQPPLSSTWMQLLDIIANNPIDQKVVELCPSQHSSLVEHSMYRSVFPPQGGENGVFLPASPRASKAFAGHDASDACGISAIARTFSVCLGSVCATTLC